MIVPTLATAIDTEAFEISMYPNGEIWIAATQDGDDEVTCLCDARICNCRTVLNGIVVTLRRPVGGLLSDLPF